MFNHANIPGAEVTHIVYTMWLSGAGTIRVEVPSDDDYPWGVWRQGVENLLENIYQSAVVSNPERQASLLTGYKFLDYERIQARHDPQEHSSED